MSERTPALVLRQVDLGEADRIVTFLTADRGRIDARASGVRRSGKRFGGLDLFVLVDISLAPGKSPPRLSEAEVRRDFSGLRDDVLGLALAAYSLELLRQAAQEEQEAPELFRLGVAAMDSLDGGAACGGWARAFELKLLHVLGARPALRRCAVTGAPAGEPLRWSPAAGGVLCGEGLAEDPTARSIDAVTINLLDASLRTPLNDQRGLDWGRSLKRAGEATRAFLDFHVGPPGKAHRFLSGLLPLLLLALAGCTTTDDDLVRVQGYLYSTSAPTVAEERVDGADSVAYDDAGEELVDGTRPSSDVPSFHRFSDLAIQIPVHLVFEPPDATFVPTAITGRTDLQDLWVDDGVFHLVPRDVLDALVFEWGEVAATPNLDPDEIDGGVVFGTVSDAEGLEGLRLVVRDRHGRAWEAAYTDADGAPSDSEGLTADGGFWICCPSDGPIDLLLLQDGEQAGPSIISRAVEDGVTSIPALDLNL